MTNKEDIHKEVEWPSEGIYDTDEADIRMEEEWFNERLAKRCIKALQKNRFSTYYAQNRGEALSVLMEMIPPGATVGLGDSVTLHQIGVIEELEKRGKNEIIFAMRKDGKYFFPGTMDEFVKIGLQALFTDFFLTGANAITLDGKILSTDKVGNRVAGLLFGPKRVIVVAGVNKIVADIEEARGRVKNIAAPWVAAHHRMKHLSEVMPSCGRTGLCVDCHSSDRICCYTVMVEFQAFPRIKVVLVGEKMGA